MPALIAEIYNVQKLSWNATCYRHQIEHVIQKRGTSIISLPRVIKREGFLWFIYNWVNMYTFEIDLQWHFFFPMETLNFKSKLRFHKLHELFFFFFSFLLFSPGLHECKTWEGKRVWILIRPVRMQSDLTRISPRQEIHWNCSILKIAFAYERTFKDMWNIGKFLELDRWELWGLMWVQNKIVHSIGNYERKCILSFSEGKYFSSWKRKYLLCGLL